MTTSEHLQTIEQAFDANVLEEIFDQYVECGNVPSKQVFEALGRVYGKIADEIEIESEAACVLGLFSAGG